jgi:chromate transporter
MMTGGGPGSLAEVAAVFTKLGCLSFGGPVAHLGYFRAELVLRRQWLDDAHYADLVALCQLLPGPASSQVVFALGMHRRGLPGALVASLCFLLPSALLMIGFAYGLSTLDSLQHAGWLHGLRVAAVAVVAHAVWGMGRSLCPDRPRLALAFASAATLLALPFGLTQIAVILVGAALGFLLYRTSPDPTAPPFAPDPTPQASLPHAPTRTRAPTGAILVLVAFAALLVVLPALSAASPEARPLAELDRFYRSGALVFGGGHVVLPLLRAELVQPGWLDDATFLAGYAAAQAVPGPLFSFAGYLGAALHPGPSAWLHGLWGLFAIFLPAWLLVGGALPLWHRLRTLTAVRAAVHGSNAAVVGVLLAALWTPVMSEGLTRPLDAALALLAFGALGPLGRGRVPPWLVVLALALAAGC